MESLKTNSLPLSKPGTGRTSPLPQPKFSLKDYLFLRKANVFERVPLTDIIALKADSNYTTIFTKTGEYIYSTVLRKVEEQLPKSQFVRVHRSYVVNLAAVTGFEGNVLFVGDMKIPVSRVLRSEVFNCFKVIYS